VACASLTSEHSYGWAVNSFHKQCGTDNKNWRFFDYQILSVGRGAFELAGLELYLKETAHNFRFKVVTCGTEFCKVKVKLSLYRP
jgi:hypothetical protein